jgi:hypothetical protein
MWQLVVKQHKCGAAGPQVHAAAATPPPAKAAKGAVKQGAGKEAQEPPTEECLQVSKLRLPGELPSKLLAARTH